MIDPFVYILFHLDHVLVVLCVTDGLLFETIEKRADSPNCIEFNFL